MKSLEKLINPESDYFIYSPSRLAQDTFLYPLQCGLFSYQPGYSQSRNSFDSFLLMYIQKGEVQVSFDGKTIRVPRGSFVLLDCYQKHAYGSQTGWEALWCHFDGITARPLYNAIIGKLGNIFSLPDSFPALRKLTSLLDIFYKGKTVQEPLLSKYLNDILTEFLLYVPVSETAYSHSRMADETITYITEHFSETISIDQLAQRVGLSPYHFIRTFKKETGFTPHEYLVNTRLTTARYLLRTTSLPIKEICFHCGFSCESVFCSAFKKYHNLTPAQYREGAPR